MWMTKLQSICWKLDLHNDCWLKTLRYFFFFKTLTASVIILTLLNRVTMVIWCAPCCDSTFSAAWTHVTTVSGCQIQPRHWRPSWQVDSWQCKYRELVLDFPLNFLPGSTSNSAERRLSPFSSYSGEAFEVEK